MKVIKKNILIFFLTIFTIISCGNSTEIFYNNTNIKDGNLSRIPKELVNIKLHDIQIKNSIQQGSSVHFDLYIENDSDESISNSFILTAYIKSTDSESKKWLYSWKINEIRQNTSIKKDVELTIPFNTVTNENGYQIILKADETNFLSESNESDNTSISNNFTVTATTLKPDLWPKINTINPDTREVDLSIFNLSSMKLGKEIFYFQAWLSKDNILDSSDTLIYISDNYQNNNFVEIGFLESFNESFIIPENYIQKEVDYYLFLNVDTTYFIPENSENNNINSQPIIFY